MSIVIRSKSNFVNKGGLSAIVLLGGSFFGLGYYIKHTFMLKYYKKIIELQGNDGHPNELSQNLKKMISEVSEEIKEFTSENTTVVPCLVPGLNALHAGTIGTWYGGVIGLPEFFEFNNAEDVNKKILVNKMNSHSHEKDIGSCFLLTDEAKKYGIAHEILHVNKITVYLTTLVPIIATFGMEKIVKFFAADVRLPTYPLFVRGLFYATCSVFGLYFWIFLHSNLGKYIDSVVEEDISSLGDEYVKGAIEYYSKAIKRCSLQAQMRNEEHFNIGYKLMTFSLIREIPLSRKLAFFEAKLKDKSNQDLPSENSTEKILVSKETAHEKTI